jgi:hypothetical protein
MILGRRIPFLLPIAPPMLAFVLAGAAMGIGAANLAGCGIKSSLRAPQDVQPEPISDLRAASIKDGIQLTWTRPTKYSGGQSMRDLSAFLVLRGEGNSNLSEVAEIPVTDRERFQIQRHWVYVDSGTALGHAYRYDVIALTSDGYRSVSSNAVVVSRTAPTPTPKNFALPKPTMVP